MTGKWMVTGEVTWDPKVFEAQGDKKARTYVKIKSEEYSGTYNGMPKYRTDYITLVSFGETATAMTKLRKGDQVVAQGRPQAGRPYTRNKGTANEMIGADLEMFVDSWDLLASAASEESEPKNSYQAPDEEEMDLNDPFTQP